jgi:hypothetical protein
MHEGSCRCGAIKLELRAAPRWVASCHCKDCRQATGAAFATYVGCALDTVTITGTPARYASSPGVNRLFCATCGSPLAYTGARWPDELHLFIGVFADPTPFTPTAQVYTVDELPWTASHHLLPRYRTTASGAADG